MKGQLHLLDENNNVLKKIPLNHILFKEDEIIKRSIALFGDDDPCIINKTFCQNYIAQEIYSHLEDNENLLNKTFNFEDLDNFLSTFIDKKNFESCKSFIFV